MNPRYLQNLVWYAGFYLVAIQERFDESVAVAKQAVEYDPLSVYARGILSQMYSQAGRSTEALVAANSARELEESFFAYWCLQGVLYSDQQFAKAAEAGEMALALSGRHAFALGPQAMIFANWG